MVGTFCVMRFEGERKMCQLSGRMKNSSNTSEFLMVLFML